MISLEKSFKSTKVKKNLFLILKSRPFFFFLVKISLADHFQSQAVFGHFRPENSGYNTRSQLQMEPAQTACSISKKQARSKG